MVLACDAALSVAVSGCPSVNAIPYCSEIAKGRVGHLCCSCIQYMLCLPACMQAYTKISTSMQILTYICIYIYMYR